MFAHVHGFHYLGLQTYRINVEVDIVAGLPAFNIVGLPDAAIKESRERVRSAIQNSEFDFPMRKITVNLAPADIKKEGPSFDLPIAISILKATGQIKQPLNDYCFSGELSLTGKVRPIKGTLLLAEKAAKRGTSFFLLPESNAREAALIENIKVIPVKSLLHTVSYLRGSEKITHFPSYEVKQATENFSEDLSEVKGQILAKRALTISAAGAHNMLMMGSPGAGKSMLAKRLPTIMPPLSKKEIIDITKIFSVAGLTNNGHNLIAKRPYRSPHHTISSAGLVGGGQSAKPGEISLSHLGVLFLDELTEFRRDSLECLRQPLEEGKISISRALRQNTYPANFCLIAAINPCRCGFYGDKVKQCLCTPSEIRRYKQKISGPLLERIDLHVNVDRLTKEELISYKSNEKSSEIRQIVIDAYSRQKKRFTKEKINLNSQMKPAHIKKYCQLNKESLEFISQAVDKLGLSGRSYDKILRVSRTIADLQSAEDIKTEHIAEAIQYRQYDRQNTFG